MGVKASYRGRVETAIRSNVRFGLATGVNAVARNTATAIRTDMAEELELRQPGFARFFVRGPSPRATPAKLVARVVVGAPASARNRDRGTLVLQHDEEGNTGAKSPVSGTRLMVPSREQKKRARPNKRSNPESWKAIARDLSSGRGAAAIARGNLWRMGRTRSTYAVISKRTGRLLVFERRGRGKRNTDLLFFSASRVRLRRRTTAKRQAARVINRELVGQTRVAVAAALSNVRVRGLAAQGALR